MGVAKRVRFSSRLDGDVITITGALTDKLGVVLESDGARTRFVAEVIIESGALPADEPMRDWSSGGHLLREPRR